jgi:phosphomevalonate kinase
LIKPLDCDLKFHKTLLITLVEQLMEKRSVVASACSKVLMSGAYLVIEPKHKGVVLATDARFYTRVTRNPNLKGQIVMKSEQFGQEWHLRLK